MHNIPQYCTHVTNPRRRFQMKTFYCESWPDYELLDCGNGRKLERFGMVILDRPEIQARNLPVWAAVNGENWFGRDSKKAVDNMVNGTRIKRFLKTGKSLTLWDKRIFLSNQHGEPCVNYLTIMRLTFFRRHFNYLTHLCIPNGTQEL